MHHAPPPPPGLQGNVLQNMDPSYVCLVPLSMYVKNSNMSYPNSRDTLLVLKETLIMSCPWILTRMDKIWYVINFIMELHALPQYKSDLDSVPRILKQ